jgi:hypothetical protein
VSKRVPYNIIENIDGSVVVVGRILDIGYGRALAPPAVERGPQSNRFLRSMATAHQPFTTRCINHVPGCPSLTDSEVKRKLVDMMVREKEEGGEQLQRSKNYVMEPFGSNAERMRESSWILGGREVYRRYDTTNVHTGIFLGGFGFRFRSC